MVNTIANILGISVISVLSLIKLMFNIAVVLIPACAITYYIVGKVDEREKASGKK